MPRNELGSLRRSQVIGTHGPGAIVDFRSGTRGGTVSVVTAGLEQWDERSAKPGLQNDQKVFEPRLQKKLNVSGFRLPPVTPEIRPNVPAPRADKLIGVRFPTWLQCPQCHRLKPWYKWDEEPGEPLVSCGGCSANGDDKIYPVPARFIRTCTNGHLDEFPWDYWVQHKPDCSHKSSLTLKAGGAAGLAGLKLQCPDCKAERSMEGCFDSAALRGLGTCRGRRPWLAGGDQPDCAEYPYVVQRGASNLYFPMIESALDIPPWSDPLQKKLEKYWDNLMEVEPEERLSYLRVLGLAKKLGMTEEALLKAINGRIKSLESATPESLRSDEYSQFIQPSARFDSSNEFEVRPEQVPPELAPWIGQITVATRLREVRVIKGFTRVNPPSGDSDSRDGRIYVRKPNWLPAVEIRGEGIFIGLSRERLAAWEQRPAVCERADDLNLRYRESMLRRKRDREGIRTITARFLLVHSLAHAVVRQVSLTCGYSTSSLRERLYVGHGDTDMAGLLVYTGSADADGTLGGLARQGRGAELAKTLEAGLAHLAWCSADPLCIEGRAALSHQLNLAACHGCMLASETTCEEFNVLLDRAMLVGTPEDPSVGYFSDYLESARTGGL